MNGLEKRPKVKTGLVRALLGRSIAENAYVEINNQISEHSIRSLPLTFVDRILADYRIERGAALCARARKTEKCLRKEETPFFTVRDP